MVTKFFCSGSTAPTVRVAHHITTAGLPRVPRSLERPDEPVVESGMLPGSACGDSQTLVARGKQSDRGIEE